MKLSIWIHSRVETKLGTFLSTSRWTFDKHAPKATEHIRVVFDIVIN